MPTQVIGSWWPSILLRDGAELEIDKQASKVYKSSVFLVWAYCLLPRFWPESWRTHLSLGLLLNFGIWTIQPSYSVWDCRGIQGQEGPRFSKDLQWLQPCSQKACNFGPTLADVTLGVWVCCCLIAIRCPQNLLVHNLYLSTCLSIPAHSECRMKSFERNAPKVAISRTFHVFVGQKWSKSKDERKEEHSCLSLSWQQLITRHEFCGLGRHSAYMWMNTKKDELTWWC